jgi:hypothetical protein
MLRPPVVAGIYPVTALIEAFGFQIIASVVATPGALTVTAVAHVADAIADVPRVIVPDATRPVPAFSVVPLIVRFVPMVSSLYEAPTPAEPEPISFEFAAAF